MTGEPVEESPFLLEETGPNKTTECGNRTQGERGPIQKIERSGKVSTSLGVSKIERGSMWDCRGYSRELGGGVWRNTC